MESAEIARVVTTALAPYLIQAGETVAKEAIKKLPEPMKKVWAMIETRFQGKPAAEAAAQDLMQNPADEDNQEAFELQVKKAVKEDPKFGEALTATIQGAIASVANTGSGAAVSGGGVAAGAGGIAIGGNVGGSVVFGNHNTIGETRKEA